MTLSKKERKFRVVSARNSVLVHMSRLQEILDTDMLRTNTLHAGSIAYAIGVMQATFNLNDDDVKKFRGLE